MPIKTGDIIVVDDCGNVNNGYLKLKEKYKRDITYDDEMENIMLIISSMFKYDNKPDTLNVNMMERYLLEFGECAIWETKEGISCTYCVRCGSPDQNGLGKDLICTSGNGQNKTFKDFKHCKDVVYIKNNKYAMPDLNMKYFAEDFTEISVTLRTLLRGSRYMPILVARDNKSKTAMETVLDGVANGKPGVIVSQNSLVDENDGSVQVINFTDPTIADKLQYLSHLRDDFDRRFYNIYGQDRSGSSKQAQVSVEEIHSGSNSKFIVPEEMFKSRKKGIDLVNKFFGCEIKFGYSECWSNEKREIEINLEMSEKELEEFDNSLVDETKEGEDKDGSKKEVLDNN